MADSAMSGTPCPSCGVGSPRTHFRGRRRNGFTVLSCRACGLAYASPRPTPDDLEAYYAKSYFTGGGGEFGYVDYDSGAAANARAMWSELRSILGRSVPAEGRVLDVGCATGHFLAAAAAEGWVAVGTDFSEFAAGEASQHGGVRSYGGTLVPPTGSEDPFDLVTMWHVLEHVVDPAEGLAEIRPLVRPGGTLFIELPNWTSLGRHIRGLDWKQLKPPEHINFFTPSALAKAVTAAGFVVQRKWTVYPTFDRTAADPNTAPWRRWGAGLVGAALNRIHRGGYARVLATAP